MPAPDTSTGYAEGDAIVCQLLTQRYATFLPIVRQTYKSMFMQEQTDKEKKKDMSVKKHRIQEDFYITAYIQMNPIKVHFLFSSSNIQM